MPLSRMPLQLIPVIRYVLFVCCASLPYSTLRNRPTLIIWTTMLKSWLGAK